MTIEERMQLLDRFAATIDGDDAAAAEARDVLPHLVKLLPYVERTGWLKSHTLSRPVNERGRPVPWYTYPAIHFLAGRITDDLEVFEFGSGGSTLWWAARAGSVEAVEHAEPWVQEMQPRLPGNARIKHVPLKEDGDYCRAATETYDVIINDGRDRVNCAYQFADHLTGRGVVVWDNAERPRYKPGQDYLIGRGFRRLDFRGHGPINSREWLTSIFYRDRNCLGI